MQADPLADIRTLEAVRFVMKSGRIIDQSGVAVAPNHASTVTTVNRIDIVIDRPAEAIWPFLLDFTKWASDQKVEYLNDRWGESGGRLRRQTFRDGRMTQDRIEEIIAIEPAPRLTVRVQPAPPDPSRTAVIANMETAPKPHDRRLIAGLASANTWRQFPPMSTIAPGGGYFARTCAI